MWGMTSIKIAVIKEVEISAKKCEESLEGELTLRQRSKWGCQGGEDSRGRKRVSPSRDVLGSVQERKVCPLGIHRGRRRQGKSN